MYIAKGDNQSAYYTALLILEISQIICSFLMLVFFIVKRAPVVLDKAKSKIAAIENSAFKEKARSKISLKKKFLKVIIQIFIFCKYFTFDPLILYYTIYAGCAIVGMFNPVFCALLLLDIFSRLIKILSKIFYNLFYRFPVLRHVGNSIWRPRYSIVLTIFLFVIFQYYFTYVAVYLMYEKYDYICETLWGCFIMIFDNTFKVK